MDQVDLNLVDLVDLNVLEQVDLNLADQVDLNLATISCCAWKVRSLCKSLVVKRL